MFAYSSIRQLAQEQSRGAFKVRTPQNFVGFHSTR